MKKIAFLVILSINFLSFSQIRVYEATNDLGTIFEKNGVVKTSFELINPYEFDTIHILNIETSCGCTAILSEDTLIAPKSKIDLKVSYDPTGRKGLFGKSIRIDTKTGNSEMNTLYLKIVGNVISINNAEIRKPELVEYKVAPMYFYPITQYDTAYLDYSYIIDFVNSLTYEVDYFQFAKVGLDIKVRDNKHIEDLTYLLRYSKYRCLNQIAKSGYGKNRLFFNEPHFILSDSIPAWAVAEIKVYSLNFNDDNLNQSKIKLTHQKEFKTKPIALNLKSEKPIEIDSVSNYLNFDMLKESFLHDSIIEINYAYKIPESASLKNAIKLEKKVKKYILDKAKKEFGVKKKFVRFIVDDDRKVASTNYNFRIWQASGVKKETVVNYQVKEDKIIKPNLPVYKQFMFYFTDSLKRNSNDFNHFWTAITSYYKTHKDLYVILESSTSNFPRSLETDQLYLSRQKSKAIKSQFQNLFYQATGDSIEIKVKNVIQGPEYSKKHFTKKDYEQFEYIKLIPVFKTKREVFKSKVNPMPYIVKYDYYFKAIDTNSFVFKKFAKYLIYEIQTNGFVEVKTESSQSLIPVEKNKPNKVVAYNHLYESKKLLFEYLKKNLTDPNRLVISEERILVQGIPYSRKTPVVRYKPFQYVTIVPDKYLQTRK